MTGVLIFHNILWSHYKGRVFSELDILCAERSINFFVVQYAATERRRTTIGAIDRGLHQYPYRLLSEGSFEDLTLWAKIRGGLEELRDKDPDIVVLPGYSDVSYWVLLAVAKLQGRKIILSFDSTELDRPRYWIKEFVKRLFVWHCDGGFTYGKRSMLYLRRLGMAETKITIRCQAAMNEEIRTVFDAAKLARRQLIQELALPPHNFCYVGRLSPEKNVSCLIQAFARLRQIHDQARDWGLLIIGEGPERQMLTELCQRERLDQVRFVGGMSWRAVSRSLAAVDILVLPSISEPWGLVVNEAMICGLPVLVSNRCGCVDDLIVPGQTGFTFNPGSPEELSELMGHFVCSPTEIQRVGEGAERLISAYTPKTAASQMFSGIQQLLNA